MRGFDNEMTPLVLDGIMYITATNQVSAIDAATGREIWRFSRPRTTGSARRRGDRLQSRRRGARIAGVSRHRQRASVAVSRVNGALLWEVVLPENTQLPYGGTMAPLVVGDLVIAGVSGGDEGIRGFLAAYRVDTGEQAWRFWTVPARGEPGSETWKGDVDLEKGGGATWLTGTYDPETDTLFWPTGNPYPDTDGSERQGRQPVHRTRSSRSTRRPGSCGGTINSRRTICGTGMRRSRRCWSTRCFRVGRESFCCRRIATASSTCSIARTERCCSAKPFVQKLTWASGIGPDGRPQLVPGNTPDENGVTTCPAIRGATNWMSTSFSPATRLFYVMAVENCFVYRSTMFGGGRGRGAQRRLAARRRQLRPRREVLRLHRRSACQAEASIAADPVAAARWRCARSISTPAASRGRFRRSATPTTTRARCRPRAASCFTVRRAASLRPSMRRPAPQLWHFETQETWKASPMTYTVNGRQYVAITSGANVLAFALP